MDKTQIGFDPATLRSPSAASAAIEDLQREIIDFDSEDVSDPQIKAEGTIEEQANAAATIYKAFGRWSSVCGAIVCWALIAAKT